MESLSKDGHKSDYFINHQTCCVFVVYACLNFLHLLLPHAAITPHQVLVFDFGSEVYVWHGKDVPLGDRKVAVKLGKQLFSGSYDYSNCRVNPLDASCTNKDVPQ